MDYIRKLTSALLILAMVLSMLGAGMLAPAAHAADDLTISVTGQHVNPLYEDVTTGTVVVPPVLFSAAPAADAIYLTSLEEMGAVLRDAMEARNEEPVIYFTSQRVIDDKEKLTSFVVDELLPIAFAHTGVSTEGDYLRWHYQKMGFGLSGKYKDDAYQYTLTFSITYYTTAEQEQTVTTEINKLLNQLDVDDASDYRKLCAIYDYICTNVTYDHANLDNNSHTMKYTCYAALIDGIAVCQGYALLLYRLALELDVDARLIAGDGGGPHGWNIAQLNGLYYNLDSTWDAGATKYDYFLVCPNNFRDHIRYEEYDTAEFHQAYPMDSKDFDPANDVCNHKYSSTITQEATCTETGVATYTCSRCGDSYTETVAALGHEEVTDEGFAATCTEDGLTDGSHCDRCDIVLTEQETIPALGHSWDDGIVTREPTETETGIRTFTCETCGETREETIPTLEHEHSYTAVVTQPTCTEAGFTTYTCSCGDSYTADEVPALGHEEVTDAGYAASCTEDGLTNGSHCSRCDIVLTEQETIPALGHSWDEGTVTREPTESETGIRTFTCETCGETREETIPTLEHEHSYTAVVTPPTCTETGFTTYTCSCGDSYTADEMPALGHEEVTDAGYAASCTEDGLTDGSHCGRCDIVLTEQETIPAQGHSWDEGTVTREPTESETGIRTFTCETCGETREETIPTLEHEHSYTAVVTDPTCTKAGFTTYTCACGDSYTADEVPALGHEEVTDAGYAASCTEDGLTDGSHCSRCDIVLTEQETIPSLGHSWDEGTVTREPTETETGIRTFTCETCGETKTEEIPCIGVPKVERIAGHDRVETAIKTANALKETLNKDTFDAIILANGDAFADALAGSYLATVKDAPILLHRNSGAGDEMNQEYILNNLTEGGVVYVLGGTAAIPEETVTALTDAGIKVVRLSGDSRFLTNLAILNEAGIEKEEILITTGWNFADCLSASATGKPILMLNTVTNELTAEQVEFLTKYAANNYTIVGGNAAVSDELEAAIDEIVTGEIVRLSGSSREETSVLVAERFFETADSAVVAFSRNFPDGLCGGPLAHALNAPLLLTNAGQEAAAADYVDKNGIRSGYILGGTGVISDASVEAIFG